MKTCLVTGASGFIGEHLTEALIRRGRTVRCLVRATSKVELLERSGAELVRGDVGDPGSLARAVDGVEVVFHLAGATCAFSEADLLHVNRDGTAHVAAACAAAAEPPLHVVVSSVAAAGPAPLGSVLSEKDPAHPVSMYGRSKLAGEVAAEARADAVPTTIVRPGIVFGPRNRETLPIFRTIRRLRCHPVVGWRTPPLSLIHVEDLVELLIKAAEAGRRIPAASQERELGEGIYFACDEQHPDYGQWGEMIKQASGRPHAPTLPLAGPAAWLAAGVSELIARGRRRPNNFNRDKIREARVPSWACSGEAARRDLGFQPAESLTKRTEETVRWYREHGWL